MLLSTVLFPSSSTDMKWREGTFESVHERFRRRSQLSGHYSSLGDVLALLPVERVHVVYQLLERQPLGCRHRLGSEPVADDAYLRGRKAAAISVAARHTPK